MVANEKLGLLQRLGLRLLGKGLYDLHPELRHRVPVLRAFGPEAQMLTNNAQYYEQNVWVRRAVDIISNNIAWLSTRVVRTTDGETWDPVQGHPLTQLLEYVNDMEAGAELMKSWAINMLIDGEVGWELAQGYDEIWTRRGNEYSVRIPDGGRRYLRVLGYHVDDNEGDPFFVPQELFVHFKFYNPLNKLRGLTPVSAIRIGVEIDEYARAWSRMFFKNSARPDYVALAPQGTTPTERLELRDSLEGDAQSLDNWHRVVVLEDGIVDVKPLNLAPKDTEWLAQREFSREEIGGMYGVPDELMGFGRDTYENFDAAQRVMWLFTLVPLIRNRDSTLSEFFQRIGKLRPNERFETDLSEVSVLQDDITQRVAQAHTLITDGTPPNLAYETVGLDIDIGEAGNVSYMPYSMVPINLHPPAESTPPLRGFNKAWEYGSDEHTRLWRAKIARVARYEEEMARLLKKEFQRQQIEVNRRLRDQKALGRGKGFEPEELKLNVQFLFELMVEEEAFLIRFGPLLLAALTAAGRAELASLGVTIDFEMNRPEVQAELTNILRQFAEKVNDTTYNDLVDVFSVAEEAGETIPEIMERLSAYWEGRKSEASLERIARTTMTSVNSAADDAAWGQLDFVVGSVWLTSLDGRERPAHREAHGQERRKGEMFEVGGEMLIGPGDPNGSPGNIINCRCTRKAVVV